MAISCEQVSFDYNGASDAGSSKNHGGKHGSHGDHGNHSDRVDRAERPALSQVNLIIAEGELVCLVGRTGSGKSTLAELLCAAKTPTSGRVLVDGFDTNTRRGRREARRRVGYVMQYPEYQLFAETVAQDIAFGPRNQGASETEALDAAREAAGLVGLDWERISEASPFDLSGGQRRRAAIAGVLAMHPQAIVLDEPAAGLDPRGRQEIMGIVSRLHESGTTIVLVSHAMDDVAALADRVVVLNEGCVAAIGTPAEVFENEKLVRTSGIGVPQATSVARDLVAHEWPSGELGVLTQEGHLPLTLEELAQKMARAYAQHRAPQGGAR